MPEIENDDVRAVRRAVGHLIAFFETLDERPDLRRLWRLELEAELRGWQRQRMQDLDVAETETFTRAANHDPHEEA